MMITRRDAIGLLTATAIANAQQPASTATDDPVTLSWLDGTAPVLDTGVSWGVPFPKGTVGKSQTFTLTTPSGKSMPLQSWPLAYWPHASMNWIGFAPVPC